MLTALIDAGMTQAAIAEAIGVTQPTVFRALNGAELRYCSGKELEKLFLAKAAAADQRDPDGSERRCSERRKAERRQAERRA